MLTTYRPDEGCWAPFMAVCWQPTGLMSAVGPLLGLYVGNLVTAVGPLLGLYVGNLHVLCMLGTYRPYEGCWIAFMALNWQPTGLMMAVRPLLGLYVGNLQAF